MINQRMKRGALSGKVIGHEFTRGVSDKYADSGAAIRYDCIPFDPSPLKSRPHFKMAIARLSQELSRSFINGVYVSAVVGSHNGTTVLLRRRSVAYFADIYILSVLCSPLRRARINSSDIISRESPAQPSRRNAIIAPTSENRFLHSAASSRYRFTTDRYRNERRATLTEIRNSQIRFPFRPVTRSARSRNVSAYFQHFEVISQAKAETYHMFLLPIRR